MLWNHLPISSTSATSLDTFKVNYSKFLLKEEIDEHLNQF